MMLCGRQSLLLLLFSHSCGCGVELGGRSWSFLWWLDLFSSLFFLNLFCSGDILGVLLMGVGGVFIGNWKSGFFK
jgi:hypothetical protein